MSDDREVGPCVPQGMVLGLDVFIVFLDDVDDSTFGTTNIIKFADDTKCWKKLEDERDRAELQETLENYVNADQCGISFNVDK